MAAFGELLPDSPDWLPADRLDDIRCLVGRDVSSSPTAKELWEKLDRATLGSPNTLTMERIQAIDPPYLDCIHTHSAWYVNRRDDTPSEIYQASCEVRDQVFIAIAAWAIRAPGWNRALRYRSALWGPMPILDLVGSEWIEYQGSDKYKDLLEFDKAGNLLRAVRFKNGHPLGSRQLGRSFRDPVGSLSASDPGIKGIGEAVWISGRGLKRGSG